MFTRFFLTAVRPAAGKPGPRAVSSDHFDPFEDDPSDDWEGIEPDPFSDPIWDPLEIEDDETLPERGDFWPEPDELENHRPTFADTLESRGLTRCLNIH